MTKHDIKPEERSKWIRQIDRMRGGVDAAPPERPFDREKFEQLREIFNGRKADAPQPAK